MEKLCHGVSIQTTDMAEINVAASGTRPGVRRAKKLSTRVDLTPMVDLGFLLITFFVFTTTMSQPMVVDLFMPKDGPPMEVGESTALTIFPMGNGKVFYYHGDLEDALKTSAYGITTFSYSNGIGEVIRVKKAAMERKEKEYSKDLFLVIKPTDSSSYKQVIDIMDEVIINDLKHYAMSAVTEEEKELIIKINGSL
jgi:biopolymer transport protein ExbD